MNEKFDLILEPGGGIRHYWHDIWKYRELFLFLAWRDILVRYKQTAIGIAWSVLRPFLTMVVFHHRVQQTGKITFRWHPLSGAGVCSHAALAIFANTLAESSNSLIDNQNLLTKV